MNFLREMLGASWHFAPFILSESFGGVKLAI